MGNLLKQISIVYFLALSLCIKAQDVKYEISVPIVSYQRTNILELNNSHLNTTYFNNLYIPNIRFVLSYNSFLLGLETYSYFGGTKVFLEKEGQVSGINLNSYSILTGYEIFSKNGFRIDLGSGITFTRPKLLSYLDYYIQPWEGQICHEDNKIGIVFWSSIKKTIYKRWALGANFRINPMFNEFKERDRLNCSKSHDHDRFHYFVSQFVVSYEF